MSEPDDDLELGEPDDLDEDLLIAIIKYAAYRGIIEPEFATRIKNVIELERRRGGLDA